ncbi:MAG: hypothetical protein JKX81_00970, partial [Arenicella sp.]|nr:hypothetical protein [Arenicella sp.]
YISLTLFAFNSESIASNASFVDSGQVKILDTESKSVYPETLIYNDVLGKFFVGSVRYSAVYEIDKAGKYKQILKDDNLYSVMGIAVDGKRGKVFVTNSDLGVSVNSDYDGTLQVAGLGIYSLENGNKLAYHDLASLRPESEHFANGVTLDANGNAYVTDSIAPVIYKVDTDNKATVFLENSEFEGEGFNLNGIVYHPDGYLIAVKKSSGTLYKIPVDDPEAFSQIQITDRFVAGDGLVFIDEDEIVLISNNEEGVAANSAYIIKGTNDWQSATLVSTFPLGDVYPTTGAVKDGKIHVIHSNLQVMRRSDEKDREALRLIPSIRQIGSISGN